MAKRWTKRSVFTERQWTTLRTRTRDWSGRGVDPDRDVRELRKAYPSLKVRQTGDGRVKFTVLTRPLHGRLYRGKHTPPTFPMGRLRLTISLRADHGPVGTQISVLDPVTGLGVRCNSHVGGTNWCLGQGSEAFRQALLEGRWGDLFGVMESVITTFNHAGSFEHYRDVHAYRIATHRVYRQVTLGQSRGVRIGGRDE